MRIMPPSTPFVDKKPTEKALDKINSAVIYYLEDLDELQKKIKEDFVQEFGLKCQIDVNSQAKFARITSKFCHMQSKSNVRKSPRILKEAFETWLKNRQNVLEMDNRDRKKLCITPAKLAFALLFNGELIKALVCILDFCDLLPEDLSAKEIALKWLLYLGETELVESKLKEWAKLSPDITGLVGKFVQFIKHRETRGATLKDLIDIEQSIKENSMGNRSFRSYEMLSLSQWILSTVGSVAASAGLEDKQFPDKTCRLNEACFKAGTIVRNKVEGLAPYDFDNSTVASVYKYLESNQGSRSATEYLSFGSAIAWMFELRKDLANAYINSAQCREAIAELLVNWRISLKSCSFIRVLQSVNMMNYYWKVVNDAEVESYRNLVSATTVNMLSPDAMIVRCSTPIQENERQTQADKTMMEITDGINDLTIAGSVPIHSISKSCYCFTCYSYMSSSSMASEYMFSWMMFFKFSQEALSEFDKTFVKIRENAMKYQRIMHRDNVVRPRPPIYLNIIFGMCAVRWLSLKIANKEKFDESTKVLIESTLKITKYNANRTIDLALTLQQLARQIQLPLNRNLSWMQPVDRRPFLKVSIESAKDIVRAVSPFGRRKKVAFEFDLKQESSEEIEKLRRELKYDMIRYNHSLFREWRFQMFTYIGRTSPDPWEAGYTWIESTSIGTRNSLQQKIGLSGTVTMSCWRKFKSCVEAIPDDMTIVQIARADDGSVYLIKLHSDRTPIIMPIAHETQMIEMMKKFTYLLTEDERISKNPGNRTPKEFWMTRRAIDDRMKLLVDEIQKNFLGAAAHLLLPSTKLGQRGTSIAMKIEKATKGAIKAGEAKEIVFLTTKMTSNEWAELLNRYGEMRKVEQTDLQRVKASYTVFLEAINKDFVGMEMKKSYTYLNICPELAQFCWEHLPIFENHPYVCRIISIHALFCQLDALRSDRKEIPLQIDVQKGYYILDPENNLVETQKRMLEYFKKFQWEGTVGAAPAANDLTVALENKDAFFYIGHGSGSRHVPRQAIKKSKCNAVSLLMGCGSVKTTPQGVGFDGKSVLLDYAIAKCPLVVGCLWTVTDGEIDRYLMKMIDDCFDRDDENADKIRQLAEAMDTARSNSKLKFLTGASVVMYGFPVVSKPNSAVLTDPAEKIVNDFNRRVLTNMTTNITPTEVPPTPSATLAPKTPRTPSRGRRAEIGTPTTSRVLRSSRKSTTTIGNNKQSTLE